MKLLDHECKLPTCDDRTVKFLTMCLFYDWILQPKPEKIYHINQTNTERSLRNVRKTIIESNFNRSIEPDKI